MMDLRDCKIGDQLITSKYGVETLHQITGETKTQWICGGLRFRKDSGRLVGGDAWSFTAKKATVEKIKRLELFAEIREIQKEMSELKVNPKNLEFCKAFLLQLKQDGDWL